MLLSRNIHSVRSRVFGRHNQVQPSYRRVQMSSFKNVPVAEVFELHQTGQYPYLDVRTPEEFTQGHPSGAVNIPVMLKAGLGMSPNSGFVEAVQQQFPDKEQTILVGCQSGRRSMAAIDQMVKNGYSSLINVDSGFAGWQSSGFPVHK